MRVIIANTPDEGLTSGLKALLFEGQNVRPRGAETLEFPTPVTTVYPDPRQRVIFNEVRNANPFFHMMEALWILAGREDVAWLKIFNRKIGDYSDNGVTFHAPYGKRIAGQIDRVVDLLRRDPDSRRAVLQIWDHNRDLGKDSLDIPCNDLVFLKIRGGRLNMTVSCRSNDIVWGCYGANVVQFSMLHEYLANRLYVDVGTYNQVSDSYHAYTGARPGLYDIQLAGEQQVSRYSAHCRDTDTVSVQPTPLLQLRESPADFDADLSLMFWLFDDPVRALRPPHHRPYRTTFFRYVVDPMMVAWCYHKDGDKPEALKLLARTRQLQIGAPYDWIQAGFEWVERASHRSK